MATREEKDYICVQDEDRFWSKVYLKDIYFIETIKSTHCCTVAYRQGVGRIRGDITALEEMCRGVLRKVKASTLVNPEHIKKINLESRLIYFPDHTYCSYAARCAGELKQLLGIRSYRSDIEKRLDALNRWKALSAADLERQK